MLSDDELFREYKKTGDKKIRDEIVNRYIYIAKILAYKSASVGVEYDDLYQVACMGIVLAADRFDEDKNVRFATFASTTAMGEIKHFLRDKVRLIKVPRDLYEVLCGAERLRADNRDMPVSELAKMLDVSEKTIKEAYEVWDKTFVQSLESELYPEEDSEAEVSDIVGYADDGFTLIESMDFINYCISKLEPREKELFTKRFLDGKTQAQAAAEMQVSQMTISRTEKKIAQKMKEFLKKEM